jgi:mono/diheme cytochrome c family protein
MKASASGSAPNRGRSALYGALIMLGVVVLVPLIVAATGVISVSAQRSLGPIDAFLDFASSRSIAFHAPAEKNPFADDSEAIAEGLPHYREMCVVCHGAPGLKRSEISEGLHPEPPNLASEDSQELSDGQIFWIITNGITSTGMPAFEEADDADTRWKIVSFVRHLPQLTGAERTQLQHEGEEEGGD